MSVNRGDKMEHKKIFYQNQNMEKITKRNENR